MTISSLADAVAGAAPVGPAAGAALRVVVVNGSPSEHSKTMGLVDVAFDTLEGMLPVENPRSMCTA